MRDTDIEFPLTILCAGIAIALVATAIGYNNKQKNANEIMEKIKHIENKLEANEQAIETLQNLQA